MKVLLAEYTTAHDPALAREGRAMLDVLTRASRAAATNRSLSGAVTLHRRSNSSPLPAIWGS